MASTWSESEYFKSLDTENQIQYQKKLKLSDGTQLPDPLSLNDWKSDVRLLPDIGWGDLNNYLINTPSVFTQQSLKAYKSLEAYNFFVCGHVQDVYYNNISDDSKFCFLKSEVYFLFKVEILCLGGDAIYIISLTCRFFRLNVKD